MFEVPEKTIKRLLEREVAEPSWRAALESISPGSPADLETIAVLLQAGRDDRNAFEEVISAAGRMKEAVFGPTVKLFVPVYLSNACVNNCLYCAYRRDNLDMPRRTLTLEEFRKEIEHVTGMGYRVLELVTGESQELQRDGELAKYVEVAREIVDSSPQPDSPSEVILMSWALDEDEFVEVREAGLDSFYLWQETYDRESYSKAHCDASPKADFAWRLGVFDRAIRAGIDRVGIGTLFGLASWEFDVLALISHGKYLEETYGVTIDAIGVPRFKPAPGAPMQEPPWPVSDDNLKLAVALYRLAFPRSHVFLNTREKLNLMLDLLAGGGSEMNIACAVFPGGYTEPKRERQFEHYSYPTDKTLSVLKERGYHPTHFALG